MSCALIHMLHARHWGYTHTCNWDPNVLVIMGAQLGAAQQRFNTPGCIHGAAMGITRTAA